MGWHRWGFSTYPHRGAGKEQSLRQAERDDPLGQSKRHGCLHVPKRCCILDCFFWDRELDHRNVIVESQVKFEPKLEDGTGGITAVKTA